MSRPDVSSAPFRAGDPTLPEEERLAAVRLAFFGPGHDATQSPEDGQASMTGNTVLRALSGLDQRD